MGVDWYPVFIRKHNDTYGPNDFICLKRAVTLAFHVCVLIGQRWCLSAALSVLCTQRAMFVNIVQVHVHAWSCIYMYVGFDCESPWEMGVRLKVLLYGFGHTLKAGIREQFTSLDVWRQMLTMTWVTLRGAWITPFYQPFGTWLYPARCTFDLASIYTCRPYTFTVTCWCMLVTNYVTSEQTNHNIAYSKLTSLQVYPVVAQVYPVVALGLWDQCLIRTDKDRTPVYHDSSL